MTPLINSTPHQDLRDWRELDKRVQAFRKAQWEKNHYHNPIIAFVFIALLGCMFSLALIYISSLFVK